MTPNMGTVAGAAGGLLLASQLDEAKGPTGGIALVMGAIAGAFLGRKLLAGHGASRNPRPRRVRRNPAGVTYEISAYGQLLGPVFASRAEAEAAKAHYHAMHPHVPYVIRAVKSGYGPSPSTLRNPSFLGMKWGEKRRSGPKALAAFEGFHGAPPQTQRSVEVAMPRGPLVKIGRLREIVYEPEKPSQHAGKLWQHESGDTGETKHLALKEQPILASDGYSLFIIRDRSKYVGFTERGIIG